MATEPPSKTSLGGLSCYAHGTAAQERTDGNGSVGDRKGGKRTTFKTSMKATKGKGDKGGKQAQRISLVSVMEQLASLEMNQDKDEIDTNPIIIRRRKGKGTEKGKEHGILSLIKELQHHNQQQQHQQRQQRQREVAGQQQQQDEDKPEGNQVARTTSTHWRGHLAPQVKISPIDHMNSPIKQLSR